MTTPVTRPIVQDDPSSPPPRRPGLLIVLALDGVLSAVAACFLLPLRIGSAPFPISAVLCGLVNTALVWAALTVTPSPRTAAAPLWAWLATVAILAFGGPGGDIVFGGVGFLQYAPLILIAGGALPPAVLLWRRAQRTG